ncbi:SPJ_0845 family protein [Lactobacillus sp. YT155]|nr:SPJ_0845 family protein [Lactobacillus sp. YT155]MDO1605336.1 SPJ_0845 family protein [Lactobacillus sp. YT155]
MALTVKRENDFGDLFDKYASLPDDVKKNVDRVKNTEKKIEDNKKSEDK